MVGFHFGTHNRNLIDFILYFPLFAIMGIGPHNMSMGGWYYNRRGECS